MAEQYEIVVRCRRGTVVSGLPDGFTVAESTDDRLVLAGTVVDQAALHGALHHLQDLRLELLDVHLVEEP